MPDVAERTGTDVRQVRRWLQDRELLGLRRGENRSLRVPSTFLTPEGPLPSLRGTITVLADGGLSDEEIVDWLHLDDDSFAGGSAVAALHSGSKTEVRRRAQEHAF